MLARMVLETLITHTYYLAVLKLIKSMLASTSCTVLGAVKLYRFTSKWSGIAKYVDVNVNISIGTQMVAAGSTFHKLVTVILP